MVTAFNDENNSTILNSIHKNTSSNELLKRNLNELINTQSDSSNSNSTQNNATKNRDWIGLVPINIGLIRLLGALKKDDNATKSWNDSLLNSHYFKIFQNNFDINGHSASSSPNNDTYIIFEKNGSKSFRARKSNYSFYSYFPEIGDSKKEERKIILSPANTNGDVEGYFNCFKYSFKRYIYRVFHN